MFAKIHEAGPPVEAQPQPLAQQLAPVTRNGGGWIFLSFPLLAIVCHLIYSPLGFNPTDDGLQLAFARRVLHGEIPHRDFISVRPALSYYAWAPAVALFGDRVLLLSRGIVWLQWAAITAAWTWLFARALPKNHLQSAEITAAGIIAFATSVHHFPIMPWHTTDGLMLASLGLMLTCSSRPVRRSLGWFIIGLAPLCKQSFVPLVPLLLLLSLDRKRWQAWMLATAPTFFYACALVMAGAGKDAWDQ
ncbi:MAG: hypothetical protein N2Z21_01045, partial [Candidatus Sumerlaeaceae bacterium]|nr:hypothetical protein [Candidatus Sumerlaeaceae bacterium]